MEKKQQSTVTHEREDRAITPDNAFVIPLEELAETLTSDFDNGLSADEARARQEIYGKNELADEKKSPWIIKFLNQFKDFMVLILIIASVVSAFLGDWLEAVVIIAIVIVNAILGVHQEGQAEKAVEALRDLTTLQARVLRGGKQSLVDSVDLVPGDIVLLEAGDVVPADMRVVESVNLKAEEASLTGESVPVEKDTLFVARPNTDLGDRANMLFNSTSVTYGRGKGVVTGIAENTEIGRIADRIKGIEQEITPLQKSLNQLSKVLGTLCLVVSVIVFVVGVLRGGNLMDMFMTAVSLAVAAIPEGLQVVVTIVLSIGMKRMAERHAIVKKLLAVETLGSVDVICSDKTGTLTQNEMTVTRIYAAEQTYELTGVGYAPEGEILLNGETVERKNAVLRRLLEIGCLCNDAQLQKNGDDSYGILGDPTEGALLTAGSKARIDLAELRRNYPKEGELPFDSERKMMSVFHNGMQDGVTLSLTKGASDIILDRCDHELTAEGVIPLTAARREELLAVNSGFATGALRVLAFAYREHELGSTDGAESNMTFVGMMGMIDPARPEVRDSIALCRRAGIRTVMITGDHKDTAVAIARDLHMMEDGDGVLTGAELNEMDDEALREVVEQTVVYARVSPEHKVRIVAALRDTGHIASMTGDGVNDAPALKQADIGVAMGITGTEVAKGTADMILTDDNFATIVAAVSEGRVIFSNIRKFVSFLLSCNVGEILVIFITTLIMGPAFVPLNPIQLLWLNLVTDSFPALALGREKAEKDIMDRPPRRRGETIINKEMIISIVGQSIAIFIAVFAAFNIGILRYPAGGAAPSAGARTFAFVTLICAELMRAYSSRSDHYSVFQIGFFSNPSMIKATLLSFGLMLVVLYIPFLEPIFGTIAPNLIDWLIMLGLGLIPFFVGEIYKLIRHRGERARRREYENRMNG
ncbi:MAG: calcium-translocating P-type ATPase, SERCA-type [Fastidiosipilaceae bacterium]|jgi:Ca2+-transporting ATPase